MGGGRREGREAWHGREVPENENGKANCKFILGGTSQYWLASLCREDTQIV